MDFIQKNLDHTLFSWSKQAGLHPYTFERGKGVYLYETSGKRFIDFSSQLMNVNIGHGDPRVAEAVQKQMSEVSYVYPGVATRVRGEVGEKLAHITPGDLSKTFFTLGGSEAIENAIKLARVYTGRHKIITHYRSYHGATYGSITAGGDPRKHAVDAQGMPNVIHVENPYAYRCPWGTNSPEDCAKMALRNLEQIIQYEGPQTVAAILIEGESGSSGCIKYPPNYWPGVKAIADRYNILTIADEVMSGFGRTGKWFGVDHFEVAPDMMCFAKGLTSGYLPLGGLIVSEKICDVFNEKALPLGLTYSAHPVSLAAAEAVLNIYESDGLIKQAELRGQYLDKKAAEMIQNHPSIGDWRNTGLFGAFELVKNRHSKEPMAPWNATPDQMGVMNKVAAKIRELGMFTFVRWNWIFVAPPLIISEAQLDEGLDIISRAIGIADKKVLA